MSDERCSECGGEIITVKGRAARRAFPEGRRCRAFFSHGAPRVRPIAYCDEPHPELIGLSCAMTRGHKIDHTGVLVVVSRESQVVVWR